MSEQTDTIEAVAEALRQCADENYDIRFDYGMAHEYAQAAIAAHTKALVDGAGEVARILSEVSEETAYAFPWAHEQACRQAAATIAALQAQLATARIEGVRAGIEAALAAPSKAMIGAGIDAAQEVEDWSRDSYGTYRIDDASDMPFPVWTAMAAKAREELDPVAIVKGMVRSAALSDLIAGDADLIDGGDDGKQ